MNKQPTRYHPALVALHWLLALALVFTLGMGKFSLKELSNASPDKIGALRGHMIVGLVIGSLLPVRLVTRVRTKLPAPASAGSALLDKLAHGVHIGLYLAVFAMAASGAATAFQAGLPQIVFFGSGAALPESLFASVATGRAWLDGQADRRIDCAARDRRALSPAQAQRPADVAQVVWATIALGRAST